MMGISIIKELNAVPFTIFSYCNIKCDLTLWPNNEPRIQVWLNELISGKVLIKNQTLNKVTKKYKFQKKFSQELS